VGLQAACAGRLLGLVRHGCGLASSSSLSQGNTGCGKAMTWKGEVVVVE